MIAGRVLIGIIVSICLISSGLVAEIEIRRLGAFPWFALTILAFGAVSVVAGLIGVGFRRAGDDY